MRYKWPNSELETRYSPAEVVLYKTKIPNTPMAQLVVVDAATMSGIPLADFQVVQEFPAGIISPETMEAMPKRLWNKETYGSRASGVITKVAAAMPEDNIRAVYVNFCPVPVVLAGAANHQFRNLDVGNVLSLTGHDNGFTVDGYLEHDRACCAVPELQSRERDRKAAYSAGMAKLREAMVKQLSEGKLDEGVIGGYRINNTRHEIAYSDTVIVVPPKDFGACLDYLNRHCKAGQVDVEKMLRGIIGNPCMGHPVLVNGTSVTLDIRQSSSGSALRYINGHKIAHPDVDAIINSAVCYPGAQQAYDDFVETSSKVSLKFHRAVANGVSWNLSGRYSVGPSEDGEADKKSSTPKLVDADGKKIRMPEFMTRSDDNGLSCMVQFRKSAGKRCEALLLGQWRKVRDFDILRRFLTETSQRGRMPSRWGRDVKLTATGTRKTRNGDEYSEALEGDMEKGKDGKYTVKKPARLNDEDRPFVELVCRLDDCLVEESWIIPAAHFTRDTSESCRRNSERGYHLAVTQDVSGIARGAKRALADMFKTSTNSAVEKLVKSRQLLDQIIKETEAEEFQDEGRWKFRVRGRSGNVYVIDEGSAGVYDNAGQHICIVRASAKFENAGYDYIASLLCVLRDDRFTAKDVYTLKSRVGA